MIEEDMNDHRVLAFRVDTLEVAFAEIKSSVKSIDESLKVLTKLETNYANFDRTMERCFGQIEGHGKRISAMEVQMQPVQQSTNWMGDVAKTAIIVIITFVLAHVVH
jgi:hypothetical protein